MNPLHILLTTGMKGEPLPYMLRSDWMITCVIFLCLFSLSYIASKAKKHLQLIIRNGFTSRERASLFDDATATEIHHSVNLILQTCILLGICTLYSVAQVIPSVPQQCNHFHLLAIFTLISFVFLLAKWGTYAFVNWIFFKKERNVIWTTTYSNLIICLGLTLLPILLLVVYFDLSPQISLISITSVIIFNKILIFWKCFNNFFNKTHGFFHLILYFCALEILPDLIIWKCILISCNKLILNI